METEEVVQEPAEETAALSAEEIEEPDASETDLEAAPPEEPEEEAGAKPSKGVQKRIDELVRQREEWKRLAEQRQQGEVQVQPALPPAAPDALSKPRSDDFETYDEYVEALTEWKAEVKLRERDTQRYQQSREQTLANWRTQAMAKYTDFTEVFHNNLPISPAMADVLLSSETGIDLAYHLGKNPTEAARIANLSPALQGRELGKLEVRLLNQPPTPRTQTKAPIPTSPVGGKETPTKKPDDMDYEEYRRWREAGGGR